MLRDYKTGVKQDVRIFSGKEIEHTPAFGLQTLFLARNDLTFDQIIELAKKVNAKAIYFGAKVLILDEPTSALGVHQASVVLKYIVKAAASGLGVILITHNVHHAYPVGNSFTILNRGKSMGTFNKKDLSREKLLGMMAGGEELDKLEVELQEIIQITSFQGHFQLQYTVLQWIFLKLEHLF